jgi:uncharacterized protein with von Willebrand factor type A (vWA) domain
MFVDFFYSLKKAGIPVSPTSFLRLQKALSLGLINSVDDFYTSARAILVKSERYFDLYDQILLTNSKALNSKTQPNWSYPEVAKTSLKNG